MQSGLGLVLIGSGSPSLPPSLDGSGGAGPKPWALP